MSTGETDCGCVQSHLYRYAVTHEQLVPVERSQYAKCYQDDIVYNKLNRKQIFLFPSPSLLCRRCYTSPHRPLTNSFPNRFHSEAASVTHWHCKLLSDSLSCTPCTIKNHMKRCFWLGWTTLLEPCPSSHHHNGWQSFVKMCCMLQGIEACQVVECTNFRKLTCRKYMFLWYWSISGYSMYMFSGLEACGVIECMCFSLLESTEL